MRAVQHQALVLPASGQLQDHARRRADASPGLTDFEGRSLKARIAQPLTFVEIVKDGAEVELEVVKLLDPLFPLEL